MSQGGPALAVHQRFASVRHGLVAEVFSLRRPELVLRSTDYPGVIVDERVLTRAFPPVGRVTRPIVYVPLRGRMSLELDGAKVVVLPGQALIAHEQAHVVPRCEDTHFLDLEWEPGFAGSERPGTTVVRQVALDRAKTLAARLALPDAARQSDDLDLAFDLFRSLGAPLGELRASALAGEPSTNDRSLARAIEEQLRNLREQPMTSDFAARTGLSPRQLQRTIAAFHERYGFNAGTWRDTRNRWRVQIAAVLFSHEDATTQGVAEEVGYRSATALARAFALAGLPTPMELQAALRAK